MLKEGDPSVERVKGWVSSSGFLSSKQSSLFRVAKLLFFNELEMEIAWKNLPRFLVPLFIAGSLAFMVSCTFDLSMSLAVPAALFITVQLQKNEII